MNPPHFLPDPPTVPVPAQPTHRVRRPRRPRPGQLPASAGGKPPDASSPRTKEDLVVRPPTGEPQTPESFATIGRATDNDLVISDVLASRHHAFLVRTPLGTEIRDARSSNGTFVNGTRVGSALLSEGHVVTIGNIDLLFTDGQLIRQPAAATGTGGLDSHWNHAAGAWLLDMAMLAVLSVVYSGIVWWRIRLKR